MPITVTVRTGAANDAELTFDSDRVVLGRGEGCDVRLPDPSVSHRHATLRAQGKDYTLIDEGSTNGTFVGDVALVPHSPRILRDGDVVRLGRVWIELKTAVRAATPDLGLATRELALALVRGAMDRAGGDTRPKVTVVEGPDIGAELFLEEEGRVYSVGRAENTDLPLADADASREHAQIVRRQGSVLVRDLGSRNGTLMGDKAIASERDTVWRGPTMLRVGATVLALEEPAADALAELEALPDELVPKDGAPPPPPPSMPRSQAPSVPSAKDVAASDPAPPQSTAARPAEAPIAPPAPRISAADLERKRGWNAFDVVVILAALAVIGGSLAGLAWLLKG